MECNKWGDQQVASTIPGVDQDLAERPENRRGSSFLLVFLVLDQAGKNQGCPFYCALKKNERTSLRPCFYSELW